MAWRCLFGHQWKEKSKAHRRIYIDISDPSTYQYGETHYLFICTKCSKLKHLNFPCLFEYDDNPDEDDDDNLDPGKILSQ